jgi:hypothetical protein
MLLPALVIAMVLSTPQAETLGSELAKHTFPAPADATDLDREITSYDVFDGSDSFVIAYYLVEADGLLHDLHVRAFDKRAGAWTYGNTEGIGSVIRIQRAAGFVYVTGHSSPSAAPTLVLDQDLKVRNTLDGWLEMILGDGRVVFQRSMTHFQPAHAALLAIYNPQTRTEQTFYPAAGANNDRGFEWVSQDRRVVVDRILSEFVTGPRGHIRFNVVTQQIQVMQDGSRPLDAPRRFQVVCNVVVRVPTCAEGPVERQR